MITFLLLADFIPEKYTEKIYIWNIQKSERKKFKKYSVKKYPEKKSLNLKKIKKYFVKKMDSSRLMVTTSYA